MISCRCPRPEPLDRRYEDEHEGRRIKMTTHEVVAHAEWLAARKRHLAKEKEFTRRRDQLSRERRDLPWELVDKEYVFEGQNCRETLGEIFEGRPTVSRAALGPSGHGSPR
jgi:predicted dithiol-disulfide oxidoreductase (DUF899 family)